VRRLALGFNMDGAGLVDAQGNLFAASDSYYDAASSEGRELEDWNPINASADAELLGELGTITARSHDLSKNNGVASGYIQTVKDNVIGTELKLAAKPDYKALGRDKDWADEFAEKVESLWRQWAATTECDAARQQTFGSMTRQVLGGGLIDGEALVLPLWMPERKFKTTLMMVDPARLSDPYTSLSDANIQGGIEVNEYGEPIAYHIQKRHPNDIFSLRGDGWDRVPARGLMDRRRVLHVYDKQRAGQRRGVPSLAAVMGDFKMSGNYQKVELRTAIANSLVSAFIESSMSTEEMAQLFNADWTKYSDGRKAFKSRLQGGEMLKIPPGDKVTPFTPSRAGGAFADFMMGIDTRISAGLNIPRELLLKDFTKTSYSSARAAFLEAWRFFRSRRKFIADDWASPVYHLFLEELVNDGRIEAPDFYENKAAYCAAEWIGAGRGYVDTVKEAKGAQMRMDMGISTQEDECAEQAKDFEQVQDQRVRELKMALIKTRAADLPDEAAYRISGFSPLDNEDVSQHFGNDEAQPNP